MHFLTFKNARMKTAKGFPTKEPVYMIFKGFCHALQLTVCKHKEHKMCKYTHLCTTTYMREVK